MKKSVVFLVAFLLASSLIHAEDTTTASGAGQGSSLAQDVQKAGTQTQQGLQDVPAAFADQSNAVLEKPVQVPENFAFMGSLFGVKGILDLRHLIVLLCLWLLLFLILRQVLEVVPFFGEGWQSWIGGAIITMLAALSGGLKASSDFFFELGGIFGIIRGQSVFQLALSIIILLAFFTLFSKIMKKVIHESHKAKAEALGETLSQGARSAKVFSEGVEKLAKEK